MRIEINKAHYPVTALGFGRRAGVWVQGCSIGCAGCISRDTWEPDASRALGVDALVDWITRQREAGLHGVTISGGEPFDQPEALAELVATLARWRDHDAPDLDLLCYSGYSLRRLRARHANVLAGLDAVIVGPYVRSRPTELIWRGSANQDLVALSARGRQRYASYVEARPERPPMQVAVDEDSIWYVGVPRAGDMDRLDDLALAAGVRQEGVSWRT